MRRLLSLIAIALAAGCAGGPAVAPAVTPAAPGVNLSGYPPAFRSGYADGCASVNAGRKRDETRFKTDTDYAQGWRDGNDICRRRR